jgi:hypothetical protein
MQRKGGEGERAHRGWCREEGRGGRERKGEFGGLTPVVIKEMECEIYLGSANGPVQSVDDMPGRAFVKGVQSFEGDQ